jgi:hypothetical protein
MIDEYRSLREEIVRLEKEIFQITLYVFTILLSIAGISSSNFVFVEISPIIYQIVLIWGLDRYGSSTRLRMRLSTYIQVFLEPKNEDLNWEERNSNFKIRNSYLSKFRKRIKKATNLFTLLYIIGIYVSFNYVVENMNCKIILIFISVLHIVSFLLLIDSVINYPNQKNI